VLERHKDELDNFSCFIVHFYSIYLLHDLTQFQLMLAVEAHFTKEQEELFAQVLFFTFFLDSSCSFEAFLPKIK